MSMTKRHFIAIADALAVHAARVHEDAMERLVSDLCAIFAQANPRFSREQFVTYVREQHARYEAAEKYVPEHNEGEE